MAIKGFKEIIDKKGYRVNSKDRAVFEREIGKAYFGMGVSDMIEFIIYDSNDNQLPQGESQRLVRHIPLDNENIRKYFLLTQNPSNMKMNGADEYIIDVEKLITEAGYSNGVFKTQVNLINRRVGSEEIEKDKLWIHEISPSRTEIRVLPLEDQNEDVYPDIQKRLNIILNEKNFRDDTVYFIKEMVESIKVDEVLKTFLTINGTVVSGENYIKLIQKEFKILDFDNFIRTVKDKLVEGTQHFIQNKEYKISSINYGKPLSTPIDIELGVDKIVEKINDILVEVINFYLPKQSIQEENILTVEEQKTLDEAKKILKTVTASTIYSTDNLQNVQPVVRGCTDPSALNYNPLAKEDDGSCIYQAPKDKDFIIIEKDSPPPTKEITPTILEDLATITKQWYGWAPVSDVKYKDKKGVTQVTKIYENAGATLTYVDGSLTFSGDIREVSKQNEYIKDSSTPSDVVIVTGGGGGPTGGGMVYDTSLGSRLGVETVVKGDLIDRQNIK